MRIDNELLFKSYIPLGGDSGKIPIVRNWPNNTSEYSSLRMKDGIGGVLNESTVLVDIDDRYQAERLLDIVKAEALHCEVRKTNRGYHFFFWNQERMITKSPSHVYTALGLEVDYKVGTSNTYAVIKQAGREREIIYSNPITNDDNTPIGYDELPCYLRLIDKKDRFFLDMTKGDGRNSAIYSYIPTLRAHKFSDEEIRKTLTVINSYIFEDPLEDDELEKAMRETRQTTQKKADNSQKISAVNKFMHYVVGDMLMSEFRFINGKLHVYKDGYYQSDERTIVQKITEEDRKQLTKRQTDEVCHYLTIKASEIKNANYQHLIPFKNGVYNVISDTIVPASSDIGISYQIPHAFNPDAYSQITDQWLDEISSQNVEKRKLLEELIGICMCSSNKYQKMFHIYGQGANGKTTFIDILVKILGEQNCSHISLDKIHERFNMQEIYGKLANISDETPSNVRKATEAIKQLTGNSPISAEAKFSNLRYNFINTATLISSGNTIPDFHFSDGGIARRIVLIRFTATFTAEKRIPDMLEKLANETSLEYLIKLGIAGLKRVISNNWRFTEEGAEDIEEIRKEGDSIYSFITDYGKRNIAGKSLPEVHGCYVNFCNEHEFSSCSDRTLSKRITEYTGMRLRTHTIAGKSVKLFTD